MAAAQYYEEVQQAYLAYYGRPADPAGLDYWATQLDNAGGNLSSIINAFGTSAESTALYGGSNTAAQITAIYETLFGRQPDATGLAFYEHGIATGQFTLASVALNIYNGASGTDAATLAAKLAYADAFTDALSASVTAQVAYSGTTASNNARAAVAAVTDTSSEATAAANLSTTLANIGAGAQQVLTSGADNVTGSNIVGSLTEYMADGKGPTLNYGDVITGASNGTNNTLTLNDDYAQGNDVLPLGATISNIQNITLLTQGNAGGSSAFDTSKISGVLDVNVTSAGSEEDQVNAAGTTAINVTHQNTSGSVQTTGGSNVTVASAGDEVVVGNTDVANANPTGAVSVTETGTDSEVFVYGGSSVNVQESGQNSDVQVGVDYATAYASEPTGAVTVDATAAGISVAVYGGTDVTVDSVGSAKGTDTASVTVGAVNNGVLYAPTGDVTVDVNQAVAYDSQTQSAIETDVRILGGHDVSVTTDAGNVTIGDDYTSNSTLIAGQNPTGTVDVTDTTNGSVTVDGGTNVTVDSSGGSVVIGAESGSNVVAPTGSVSVTDTAKVAFDGILNTNEHDVTILGGTNVSVTTNAGGVTIGDYSGTVGAQPSGTVQVTDTTASEVDVYGGTNVSVNSAGGWVEIGNGTAATDPTGNITVTESAIETGWNEWDSGVDISGGKNVTVNTTGGDVWVGDGNPAAGAVSITDTFVGNNIDSFYVNGGTTVSITTTATDGDIEVGNVAAEFNTAGTALSNAAEYASGNVTIVNESLAGTAAAGASNVYGTGETIVNTDGATSVSITGGGAATITDMETTQQNGKAIGTSTLSSVTLDHVEGSTVITSDALTSLTLLDGESGEDYTIDNNTAGHALSLTLGGDATGTDFAVDTIIDASAGSVSVTDNGVASGQVDLQMSAATTVTVNTTAALSLDVESATALTNLTVDNTGALNLEVDGAAALTNVAVANTAALDLSIYGATALTTVTLANTATVNLDIEGATKLASIDASAATGAVNVELDPTVTSFKGGSGDDTVTLSQNSLLESDGKTYSTIAGGAGNNVLVADYAAAKTDVALGTNSHVTGFSTLALGADAVSDAHTGTAYVAPVAAAAAVAEVDAVAVSGTNVAVDDVIAVTIGGNTYDYTVQSSDVGNAATLASHLAATLVGDGAPVSVGYTAGSSSFTLTGNANGAAIGTVSFVDSPAVPGTSFTVATDSITTSGKAAVLPSGDASYDASGFSALTVGQTAGDVTFSNVAAGTTLTITGSQSGEFIPFAPGLNSVVNYVLAKDTANDSLNLTVGVDGTATTGTGFIFTELYAKGVENLHVNSVGAALDANGNPQFNVIEIGDSAATSVTLTGDQNTFLAVGSDSGVGLGLGVGFGGGLVEGTSNITSIDASGSTGNVDIVAPLSASGATITGGAGMLMVEGSSSTSANDVINTGSGGGDIEIGAGGSWNGSLNNGNGAFDSGTETVNLSASTAVSDDLVVLGGTVAVNNGKAGGVTGFNVTANAKTADSLTFGSAPGSINVLADTTSVQNVATFAGGLVAETADLAALSALTFTSANGILTFGAAGTHTVSEFTTAQLIEAAEEIVTAAADAADGAQQVLAFVAGGNTYVVASDATGDAGIDTAHSASVTELIGVTGVTGFGTDAAANTIVVTNLNVPTPIVLAADSGNSGTAKAAVYDETGFSYVTLGAAQAAGTASTALNNLAAAAQIDISATSDLGQLSVTQVGTAGTNSLALDFIGAAATAVDTLTVSGDNALTIHSAELAGATTITSLIDATNTVATITIDGGAALSIGSVSDTALTTVDASAATGALTLTAAQSGLTILGALGGDTITANGAADTITVGDAVHSVSGDVSIAASGAHDVISVLNASGTNSIVATGAGDTISVDLGVNTIQASGAGDAITVDGGSNNLGGALHNGTWLSSLGAGDTINLLDGNTNVWVGSGSTVNLGTSTEAFSGSATIQVTGDVTGATSAGHYALTLINGVANANGEVLVQFGNATTEALAGGQYGGSEVNTATATSLANALDIAVNQALVLDAQSNGGHTTVVNGVLEQKANTGLVTYFQYAGNTYVVEAVNNTNAAAAHNGLAAGDVVVELTGQVNLNNQSFANGVLHVHDVVVG
jgi:hypothetical protein